MRIMATGNSQKKNYFALDPTVRSKRQLDKLDAIVLGVEMLNIKLDSALKAQRFSPQINIPQKIGWFARIKQLIEKI